MEYTENEKRLRAMVVRVAEGDTAITQAMLNAALVLAIWEESAYSVRFEVQGIIAGGATESCILNAKLR